MSSSTSTSTTAQKLVIETKKEGKKLENSAKPSSQTTANQKIHSGKEKTSGVYIADEEFHCLVCYQTAFDALETPCCNSGLICTKCAASSISSQFAGMAKCIICREYLYPKAYRTDATDAEIVEAHGYKTNSFVKRLLAKIPCKCYVCKEEVSRAELEEHESQCLTKALAKKKEEPKDEKPATLAEQPCAPETVDFFLSQDEFDCAPVAAETTGRSLEDELLSPKSLDFVKQFDAFDLCEQLPIQTAILLPPPPIVPAKYKTENKPQTRKQERCHEVPVQEVPPRAANQRALERLRARAHRFSVY